MHVAMSSLRKVLYGLYQEIKKCCDAAVAFAREGGER